MWNFHLYINRTTALALKTVYYHEDLINVRTNILRSKLESSSHWVEETKYIQYMKSTVYFQEWMWFFYWIFKWYWSNKKLYYYNNKWSRCSLEQVFRRISVMTSIHGQEIRIKKTHIHNFRPLSFWILPICSRYCCYLSCLN